MGNCTQCCCRDATLKELTIYLIVFILFNLIFSLIPLFCEVGETDRYKEAMQYLYEIENNSINKTVPLECLSASNDSKEKCELEGREVFKQAKTIRSKNIFKNWKKNEKVKNYIRLIATAIYFISMCIIKCTLNIERPTANPQPEQFNRNKLLKRIFIICSVCSIILIIVSIIIAIVNFEVDKANKDIGLYPDDDDDYYYYILINIAIDFLTIFFSPVEICFSIRIYEGLKIENYGYNNINNNNNNNINNNNININNIGNINNNFNNNNNNFNQNNINNFDNQIHPSNRTVLSPIN